MEVRGELGQQPANGDSGQGDFEVKVHPEGNVSHDDSGHESQSNGSSTPPTPGQERSITPGDKSAAGGQMSSNTSVSYRVKIISPNGDALEIQIGGSDNMQEIYQMLQERDSNCHRTCFKIYYDGKSLDPYTEIQNIPNMVDNAEFKVVEEPYNVREVRVHVRQLREVLRSFDAYDAANGIDYASFSCLSEITQGEEGKQRVNKSDKPDESYLPPSFLIPGAGVKDLPLKTLLPMEFSKLVALKNVAYSAFNPPPGPRKLKGDLLYLFVDTMEDRRFNITCCTRGFYLNATVGDKFNPGPPANSGRGSENIFHSLFDLLSELSPHFRRVFTQILKARGERHIYERIPTPYQTYCWMTPLLEQAPDQIRADDLTQPHRIGLEDHMPGQIRDWNEELQATYDMPRTNFHESLCRSRAKFKSHSDFVAAATKGAVHVVDGSVITINPMDDAKTHVFIWNNVFFSMGFDIKDHYKEVGGDAAAHAAAKSELNATRAYYAIDTPKLHCLGMCVIDYKGFRIAAQSIVPGILEKEQEDLVVYGSFDSGKTAIGSEIYEEYLSMPAKQLKIQPHKIWNGKEEGCYVKLLSSVETKGIVGNDGRHYLLDLLRVFPPDVNFLENGEVTELCKKQGFPRAFRHKLVTYRPELLESFVESRCVSFVRIVTALLNKHNLENNAKVDSSAPENLAQTEASPVHLTKDVSKEIDCVEKLMKEGANEQVQDKLRELESCGSEKSAAPEKEKSSPHVEEAVSVSKSTTSGADDDISEKVVAEATKLLGLQKDHEFDIRFNPDCYSENIVFAPEEDLPAQRKQVAEVGEFLIAQQIPAFIRDCVHQMIIPIDGASLVEELHNRGINLRYLGKLVEIAGNSERIDYVLTICKLEMLCRCARRFFREYIRDEKFYVGAAVAHFLNCLLGPSAFNGEQFSIGAQIESIENGQKKNSNGSKKRRKTQSSETAINNDSDALRKWTKLTQQSLWAVLVDELSKHYGYKIEAESCDQFIGLTGSQKQAVLRRFCILAGIQLCLQNYQLDASKAMGPFVEADIFNLTPVVKHINPRSQEAYNLYLGGVSKMQTGFTRVGYELISQALNMMSSIYGPLHPDLVLCHRLMARISYAMADLPDALSQSSKALIISERCSGVDSHEAITDYLNTAHYFFANLRIAPSLKLFYRARFLLLLSHGEIHPIVGQIDTNIGLILYWLQQYELALKFLNNALALCQKYSVTFSIKTALVHHVLARTHSCRGDFRTAIQHEKETYKIYATLLGDDNLKTKMSGEYLNHLTKEAVTFQRRVNDACGAELSGQQSLAHLIPVSVQQPSLQNIVDMLNIVNNFVFYKIHNLKEDDVIDGGNEESEDAKREAPLKQIAEATPEQSSSIEELD